MSARGGTILGRFPRHLALDERGKRIGTVVDGLAHDLDVQTSQVGAVRTAHRFGDADLLLDVVKLAALHGLGASALEPVRIRLGDLEPAPARPGRLARHRSSLLGVIEAHRSGNGTPAGLLSASASYLGLDVDAIDHTPDRWWHLATCTDTLAASDEEPAPVLLAVEENPFRPADIEPSPRRHGAYFQILRGGLEAVSVTTVVVGIEDRTVSPMVVNVDLGIGVGFDGVVDDGEELRFHADGRVTLGEEPAAVSAYGFRGAVFAGPDSHHLDFVFASDTDAASDEPPRPVDGVLDDHRGHWAITMPVVGLFEPEAAFPHADGLVDPLVLARGRSRIVAFAGVGSFEGPVAPRPLGGRFDTSVFAIDATTPASLALGFDWDEREPFAVRVWIPFELADLDVDGQPSMRERLRTLLDRHRAAGVRLSVEYADPRWTLGTGVVRDLDATDPQGIVIAGTTTWPDDTPQDN